MVRLYKFLYNSRCRCGEARALLLLPSDPIYAISRNLPCEDAVAGVGQTGRGLSYVEAGVVAQVVEDAGYNDHWK